MNIPFALNLLSQLINIGGQLLPQIEANIAAAKKAKDTTDPAELDAQIKAAHNDIQDLAARITALKDA